MVLMVDILLTRFEKRKRNFSKFPFDGTIIMTWRCFSFNKVETLDFISTKMNSEAYKEVLEENLLTNVIDLARKNWIFRQDNAAIHKSLIMKTRFKNI